MLAQEKEIVRDVQFKTVFRVYLCLLRLKEASTKDVQRAMMFPTPAQAKYHLRRLAEIGLVVQLDDGNFKAVSRQFGILRFFFKFKSTIIPMSLFYAVFFSLVTVLLYLRSPSLELLLLAGLVVAKEAVDTYSYFAML